MQDMLDTLKHLQRNPFFRTVGTFKGLNQESLILQRATGYSQVYRTWNLLRRAYSLNDGIYRLHTKDIATLYEIWCFIEVSHIVKEQLGLGNDDVEHRNRMEMNGAFTWELGKGEHSRILFRKDGVELAELVYNPKHTEKDNVHGIGNLYVPTVPQKPDIVLQLTKDDVQKGMKMTYDISHSAKLIDIEEYNINGYGELFGYLSGLCAGNYDITDVFVDGLFKICGRDYNEANAFFDRVAKLAENSKANFTFTVSADMKDLPADMQRYI